VIPVIAGNTTITKVYSSTIEGVINVEIRPQVSGYLTKILADEGAFVKTGQSLFLIDDKAYREQLNTAMGALHAAEANMESAKISLDKQIPLVKANVVSDITLQTAKAGYNAAKAAVEQASAAVQSARINVGYCTITAPVNGYLGRFPFRLGSLVSPAGTEPLTMLSDIHNVNAYFSMAESDFIRFRQQYSGATIVQQLGKMPPVELQLADGGIYGEKGRISAVEGQFDKSTGSITLRATFPNGKTLLRSGNTGKILITQNLNNVMLIPIASTVEIQEKVYVYKVDANNKVKQTMLQIDGKSGGNYIVSEGIKDGEKIVTKGFERLQDGMTILPEPAK
jgi:RND family efflux transporter MFP subunit